MVDSNLLLQKGIKHQRISLNKNKFIFLLKFNR